MRTFVKAINDLTWLSQIFILFLFLLIMANLVTLKLSLKWWLKCIEKIDDLADRTSGNNNKQGKILKKQLIKQQQRIKNQKCSCFWVLFEITKSYSFLQLFTKNMSINKAPLLSCLALWIYFLICTQFFVPAIKIASYTNQQYQTNKFKVLFIMDQIVRSIGLGALGLGLVIIDLGIRYFSIKTLVYANRKKQSKIIATNAIDPKIQGITNTSYPSRIPKRLYFYYLVGQSISILSFCLCLFTILTSDSFSGSTNFYSLHESIPKLSKAFVFTFGLVAILYMAFFLLGLVAIGISKLLGKKNCQVGYGIWELVVGQNNNQRNNKKICQQIEESVQNLGCLTERNRFENLIFCQNQNNQLEYNIKNLKTSKKFVMPISYKQMYQQKIIPNDYVLYDRFNKKQNHQFNSKQGSKKQTKSNKLPSIVLQTKIEQKQQELKPAPKQNQRKIFSEQNNFEQNEVTRPKKTNKKSRKNQKIINFFHQQQICQAQIKQKPQRYSAEEIKQKQALNKNLQIKQAEEKNKDLTISEPILRNIENKIQPTTTTAPKRKGRKSKQQLKVIENGQNWQGVDTIDLNSYALKDLGCIKAQLDYRQPIINVKQLRQLSKCSQSNDLTMSINASINNNKLSISGQKRYKSISNRRKKTSRKKPTIPEIKNDAHTFCMPDLSF